MPRPACPICAGTRFAAFNGRAGARCEECGALERGRNLWLVYRRLVRLPDDAQVVHFAPEKFLLRHFAALPGVRYLAFDRWPEHYASAHAPVLPFDLCADLATLPPESADLLIHSHVLEHLPCPPGPVLAGMARVLKPGGVMLFCVPIEGEESLEGLDPATTPEEREMRARQGEHLRRFGKRDFAQFVAATLGQDCLVRQRDHFTPEELAAANVRAAEREPNGRSVFLFRKPGGSVPA
jgi:SAM-dependent methyltransferase